MGNSEFDDSNYFSQSETSSHRDYSEELKHYKYRDRKKRDWSPDKEDYKAERRVDNRKKDRHSRKKRKKDKERSYDSDLDEKYGSYDISENELEERRDGEFSYKNERKSKRKKRSYSHEMSDEYLTPEKELRGVRKRRSKKEKRYEKEISKRDRSRDRLYY